jgi:hypothetical protein
MTREALQRVYSPQLLKESRIARNCQPREIYKDGFTLNPFPQNPQVFNTRGVECQHPGRNLPQRVRPGSTINSLKPLAFNSRTRPLQTF